MLLEIIGRTIDVIGKLLVAFTAIMVHHRFLREHKIDNKVFKMMKREQFFGILGVVFIVLGFVIEMISKII